MAPNRDASTEKKKKKEAAAEVAAEAAAEAAEGPVPFPTSEHLRSARRAAGKIRPNQPQTLDELFELVDRMKIERG